jgi:hypothetical protein
MYQKSTRQPGVERIGGNAGTNRDPWMLESNRQSEIDYWFMGRRPVAPVFSRRWKKQNPGVVVSRK